MRCCFTLPWLRGWATTTSSSLLVLLLIQQQLQSRTGVVVVAFAVPINSERTLQATITRTAATLSWQRRQRRLVPVSMVQLLDAAAAIGPNAALLSNFGEESFASLLDDTGNAPESVVVAGAAAAVAAFAFYALDTTLLIPRRRLVSESTLQTIVAGTFLSNHQELRCLYKASRDGWSALDFHEKVDDAGSAVLVCRTRSGVTLGGYNPSGWRSTDDYYSSTTAFLYTLQGGNSNRIQRYPIRKGGGGNTAIFDYATGGPCFGTADLQLGPPLAAVMGGFAGPDVENLQLNAGTLRRGVSTTAGFTYETDKSWPVRGTFAVVEVEVYGR
jgi:TLD